MYMYMYIHVYIYIYTHTHIYIYIYVHTGYNQSRMEVKGLGQPVCRAVGVRVNPRGRVRCWRLATSRG